MTASGGPEVILILTTLSIAIQRADILIKIFDKSANLADQGPDVCGGDVNLFPVPRSAVSMYEVMARQNGAMQITHIIRKFNAERVTLHRADAIKTMPYELSQVSGNTFMRLCARVFVGLAIVAARGWDYTALTD